jgi:aryl-alcohol dehydrogenase-like predicted oxidoreductase
VDRSRRAILSLLGGLIAVPALSAAPSRDMRLMTRAIPATGESLPVIGLGTWQVFDAGDDAARRARLRETLAEFARAGARLVDSSPMYGSSEAVVGDLAAELGLKEKLFLATKVWTRGREEGVRQMQRSLERLRAQRIDLMQIHNLLDADVHTATLLDWKAGGRVRYIGITHYHASAHAELARRLEAGRYDFVQVNYSLAEPEAERRVLPLALQRGVAVIVNRPFAEGGLFRRVRGRPLPPWAQEIGVASWAQYFLKWIIGHPAVTCAIPGTGRADHLRDNLEAGRGLVPDAAARERMRAYVESL